jgi:hypothetical protein
MHEYVHTQEKGDAYNLLSQCIFEGACDFIASLVTGKTPPLPYMDYGPKNEPVLKEQFKTEMFGSGYRHWLYNGSNGGKVGDLGYYMGYAICRAYYNNAPDKKKAVREIIELNFSDSSSVESFLEKSRYYSEPIDKQALVKAYNEKRPHVTNITPFANGDTTVDTSYKELRIAFSMPMNPNGVSIDLGPGGRDHYPIVKRVGFSEDKKSITFVIALKPDYEYGFILTDGSFRSEGDYPLVPFEVKFKTRK